MQYPAWFRRNVGLVECWFGFFFYHGRKLLFYPGCRSPPLEIWKLIHFQISEVKDERREKYSGSKTRNYFTAYLLASIQGRRLRYLEKQQKILFAEENLEDKEITDIDISLEERLELEKKEQLLLDESKGIYPEWNEMTDINLMEAMFSLQEEERKLIYQHVFEERTFKEMSILNQMPEERCKGAYYWAIRKIRKRMGGKRS